jgi:hypothetical protein
VKNQQVQHYYHFTFRDTVNFCLDFRVIFGVLSVLGYWAFLVVSYNCYLEGLKLLEKKYISLADIYWKYFDFILLFYYYF